jgi:hypothetical protein
VEVGSAALSFDDLAVLLSGRLSGGGNKETAKCRNFKSPPSFSSSFFKETLTRRLRLLTD